MGRFHRYCLHNVLLIAAQRPSAVHVVGFQTWNRLHRFVRRGEKGIAILAPIVRRLDAESRVDEEQTVVGFRTAYAFDIAQTDGEPLPEASQATGEPGAALEHLRTATRPAASPSNASRLGGELGVSRGGRIRIVTSLRPRRNTSSWHEYVHELLHHWDDRPQSRDTRQLEGEAVAFVVGHARSLEPAAGERTVRIAVRSPADPI